MRKNIKDSLIDYIRHSLAHLLAAAVLKKFPKAKLGIGPTIENGFYYDFLLPRALNPEDLKEFEKTMREFIAQKLPFSGKKITASAAKKLFAKQPFKLELIKEFIKERKRLTVYEIISPKSYPPALTSSGEVGHGKLKAKSYFTDLCRGGHIKNTSEINPEAFKLDKIAGAYWRGDEKNKQLQRIYGLAFGTKSELREYLATREEAERRDHKILGPKLDLFTFSDLVGPGFPLWTPKGTILRDLLDNFVWELRKKYGYEKVDIPHLAKKELYEKSGHWEKFKEDLFRIKTREGHEFAIKPMNCPHHIQIFQRKQWSYRELPQRYASTTKVYRDEQTGELSGLSRVRAITQDDAHVFCRKSSIPTEIDNIWNIIEEFYKKCGFPHLSVRLSLRNPKQPKKYLGSADVWDKAEEELKKAVQRNVRGKNFEIAVGEAAFYGPKIDFMTKDSIGRKWQVATIQLDMNMPERFNLTCINESGEKEKISMVHAAIMGAIERFIAILIEHHAGALPVWLAPVQAAILPIGDKFKSYAKRVYETLKEAGIRVGLPEADETLGKRIREAETQKIPYILVVGEKEEKNKTVNVRHYKKGQLGEEKIEKFLEKVKKEIEEKTI